MGGMRDNFEVEGTISGRMVNNESAFAATAHVNVQCPVCIYCGRSSVVTVPEAGYREWIAGAVIQVAFPDLDGDTRDLLLNGIHSSCGPDEEDHDSSEDDYEGK